MKQVINAKEILSGEDRTYITAEEVRLLDYLKSLESQCSLWSLVTANKYIVEGPVRVSPVPAKRNALVFSFVSSVSKHFVSSVSTSFLEFLTDNWLKKRITNNDAKAKKWNDGTLLDIHSFHSLCVFQETH